MLRTVIGLYDGNKLELKEKVEIKGIVEVMVTFLKETDIATERESFLQRLLNRKPLKIAPLKTKDLIEEGRR